MGHELDVHDDTTWDAKISSVEWQQNECTIEIVVHAHIILPWDKIILALAETCLLF